MATINGTPNGESLDGTAGDDTINGFGGDDFLDGGEDNDGLFGDEGNNGGGDGGGNGDNNDFVDLSNFTFSRRSDVVEENNLILIPGGSFVSTLAGNDTISSVYTTDTPTISFPDRPEDFREAVFGVYNQESLDTSSGRDVVLGNVTYTGESLVPTVYGITQAYNGTNNGFTSATISTGSGKDRVSGLASSSNSTDIIGISNSFSSEINTGQGNDEIKGEATGNATNAIAGISQITSSDFPMANNLITTGNGNDEVIGKVNNSSSDGAIRGISQGFGDNQIITDNGNDKVIGEVSGSAGFIFGISQSCGRNQIITGEGSDEIIGEASGDASRGLGGIVQSCDNGQISQIITGNGNDKVIGNANGNLTVVTFQGEDGQQLNPAITGISQQFVGQEGGSHQISTGNGADEVRGTASGTATANVSGGLVPILGIAKLDSAIETGKGNDKVIGEASGIADQIAGIVQQGSTDEIDTGEGKDEIIGTASGTATVAMAGIAQQPNTAGSQIVTGEGNDKIVGTASNDIGSLLVTAGILGDLDINTGSGNDEVIASAQVSGVRVDGFAADPFTGGSVTVDTGSGNDLVKGFGQGNFDGGKGDRDIYDLSEYSQSEFTIEIGTGENNEADFILGESTAFTQGFEIFRFADGELSFSDLA